MRTIRFRGKTDSGGWVYGSLLTWPDGKAMIYDTLLTDGSMGGHKVSPDTVGQFTGLKDMKGREVYEGDIVHTRSGGEYEIRYEYGEWQLIGMDSRWLSLSEEVAGIGTCETIYGIEVIGNLYDEP